ncbi:dihydroxyacetone kinase phosphoryl donor subunit DhaM [Flindersiella endophytica]
MTVGLVLVSHVAQLAEGVRELAAQMAPGLAIEPAGGTDEGGIGTSFEKVQAAVSAADSGDGVVLLYDLGSALMTADLVLELLEEEQRERVRIVDAPLVEGALAAAAVAQHGSLDEVVAAASAAGGPPAGAPGAGGEERFTRTAVLRNAAGLHARPAAAVARLAGELNASVTIDGVPAVSVLGVVALALHGGDEVEIGASSEAALEQVTALVESGFGEPAEPPAAAERPADGGGTPASPGLAAGPADGPASGSAAERKRPAVDALPGVAGGAAGRSATGRGAGAGTPASPGVAVGPAVQLRRSEPEIPERPAADPAAERDRLATALGRADADLASRPDEIAAAHRALLADPALRGQAEERIAAGASAEAAWWAVVQAGRELLAAADRAADIEDVGLAVLAALGVPTSRGVDPGRLRGAVVLAGDLVPSDVPALAAAGVAGIALERGGPTAHVAILARGLDVPMVVRLGELDVPDGTTVIVDGTTGSLTADPSPAEQTAAESRVRELAEQREEALAAARGPVSVGGRRILVAANIAGVAEARAAVDAGADGVGLLRTELLYVDRPELPREDEQAAELAEILTVLGDRPVTIRTLDVGGDKLLPALHLDPWRHGPLGVRGLRYGLSHPELLRTQLRAILRASHGLPAQVSVMAPMVTVPEEAVAFRQLVAAAAASLAADGVAYAEPAEVGVMVEVPAAALLAAELGAVVDFVSVGSNDLTQYVLAADRTNDEVAFTDDRAVWRAIELVAQGAAKAGCRVALCGELAAIPAAAARLVGLGVGELSMAPASIPAVKAALRDQPARPS